jgi:hypothetical protein
MHALVKPLSIDNAAKLWHFITQQRLSPMQTNRRRFPQGMKKMIAVVLALFAFMAVPAMAQQVEFDIYDKSDFNKQLATNAPVIVHVNTTW